MTTETDDPRDLRISREVSAPRDLVWAALTTPAHLARWWGPSGFRTVVHTHELRQGGTWHLTMHGPDGQAYPNHIVFDEVAAPARLALRYLVEPGREEVHHHTRITLDEVSPTRTRITLTMRFASAEVRREVAEKYGAVEGGRQTLDKLEALLTSRDGVTGEAGVVLQRVLAAPVALVWDAWTDAERLAAWFHPTSWSIFDARLDLRVGGTFLYGFRGAQVPAMYALWRFTAVDAQRQLAFEQSFADATGAIAPSPFGRAWPERLATTVTLEQHAGLSGGTLLTLHQRPLAASDAERAAYEALLPSMHVGWGETLDSLVAFVGR